MDIYIDIYIYIYVYIYIYIYHIPFLKYISSFFNLVPVVYQNVPNYIINPRHAQKHKSQKETNASQSDLVPSFLSLGLSYLHLSALPHRFFSMYL
jgi:hypothetical protein